MFDKKVVADREHLLVFEEVPPGAIIKRAQYGIKTQREHSGQQHPVLWKNRRDQGRRPWTSRPSGRQAKNPAEGKRVTVHRVTEPSSAGESRDSGRGRRRSRRAADRLSPA
ncbi:MAG TPA: hypothetical protein VIH59_18965 [Candidatus Tectomicrobia bacterium]